jgi:hypothetical protein
MSWVNDLSSGMGIPAGAATLAVAMYAACSAAEKAARPEALRDIGRMLRDSLWSRSLRPSLIIEQVFVWTFGDRHLSWKCIRRSATATVLFSIVAGLIFHSVVTDTLAEFRQQAGTTITMLGVTTGVFVALFSFCLLPDYIALWKTRLLIGMLHRRRLALVVTPVLDLILSFAASYLCALMTWVVVIAALSAVGAHMDVTETGISFAYDPSASFTDHFRHSNRLTNWHELLSVDVRGTVPDLLGHVTSLRGVLFLSTLFTSIWTILILISVTVLKLLVPLEVFTTWFFDVNRHPVQAIGIVSGTLVMAGSLIWTLLRSVI